MFDQFKKPITNEKRPVLFDDPCSCHTYQEAPPLSEEERARQVEEKLEEGLQKKTGTHAKRKRVDPDDAGEVQPPIRKRVKKLGKKYSPPMDLKISYLKQVEEMENDPETYKDFPTAIAAFEAKGLKGSYPGCIGSWRRSAADQKWMDFFKVAPEQCAWRREPANWFRLQSGLKIKGNSREIPELVQTRVEDLFMAEMATHREAFD